VDGLELSAQGWLRGAVQLPSPNANQRPVGSEVSLLVVHNISLPPGQFGGGHIEAFFCNALEVDADPYFAEIAELQVSAHFLIARCGAITQFVATEQRAWHAGQSQFNGRENCNDFSIGVELEGCDDVAYSGAQYRALADLSAVLMARYPAIKGERVVGHSDIAPGRKSDPGDAFDWQRYRSLLAVAD